MTYVTILGTFGALIILVAFILNQTHKWKDDYLIYDLFNVIGSVLLIIYAFILSSYPFIILNLVWGGLSLRDVILDIKRDYRRKGSKSFIHKWLK
jgi:hypothetical protein